AGSWPEPAGAGLILYSSLTRSRLPPVPGTGRAGCRPSSARATTRSLLELGDLEGHEHRGAAAAPPRCCRRRWTEFGELRHRRAELGSAGSATTNCQSPAPCDVSNEAKRVISAKDNLGLFVALATLLPASSADALSLGDVSSTADE